jgi:type I site-specific restriction endonuclease
MPWWPYLQSPIKFYQMVGRGTRIHEETAKYKFWLYDYTGVTDLFGTEFITKPHAPEAMEARAAVARAAMTRGEATVRLSPRSAESRSSSIRRAGSYWSAVTGATPRSRLTSTARR